MRACLDSHGADPVVVDAESFLHREFGSDRQEIADALAALAKGRVYLHPRQAWSLTPIPEKGT